MRARCDGPNGAPCSSTTTSPGSTAWTARPRSCSEPGAPVRQRRHRCTGTPALWEVPAIRLAGGLDHCGVWASRQVIAKRRLFGVYPPSSRIGAFPGGPQLRNGNHLSVVQRLLAPSSEASRYCRLERMATRAQVTTPDVPIGGGTTCAPSAFSSRKSLARTPSQRVGTQLRHHDPLNPNSRPSSARRGRPRPSHCPSHARVFSRCSPRKGWAITP